MSNKAYLLSLGCLTIGLAVGAGVNYVFGSLRQAPSQNIRPSIISIVPMHFPNGSDALVLNYRTDISIDDMSDLRKEVDELWSSFRKNVESANMTNGVILIFNPKQSRLATQNEGCGFVFEKRADGQWHCLQDDKK